MVACNGTRFYLRASSVLKQSHIPNFLFNIFSVGSLFDNISLFIFCFLPVLLSLTFFLCMNMLNIRVPFWFKKREGCYKYKEQGCIKYLRKGFCLEMELKRESSRLTACCLSCRVEEFVSCSFVFCFILENFLVYCHYYKYSEETCSYSKWNILRYQNIFVLRFSRKQAQWE